jgi:hypothetical protein
VGVSRFLHPLARSAEKGLTESIKCLVEAGANANVPDKVRLAILLHYSSVLRNCNLSKKWLFFYLCSVSWFAQWILVLA